MQYDAGYPSNFMPAILESLPKQVITVVPAGAGVGTMKEQYGRSLQILLGVCGLLLLIACANVANLLLARAMARRGQTAVRLAMGASRRQIVTHALLESVLLAVAGAVAGLVVAVVAARLLLAMAFAGATFLPIDVRPAPMVLTFAFGLALVTGIVFGTAPAWFATRTDPIDALRGAGRSTRDHSSFARRALLIVQAGLSVVLVAGSTMLARSLGNLEGQDFGFEIEGRVLVGLNRPPANYSGAKLATLYRDLDERLNRLPGVRATGLALYNPLTENWSEGVLVAGHPPPKPGDQSDASWDRVSRNYLQNLGVTLVRGRYFTAADNETSEPVAVVNEAFVRRFFKSDESPIDQHFGMDLPEYAGTYRIVGIVRDAKFAGFGLDRPARAMFYVPLEQTVDYKHPLMKRLETQSHFVRGLLAGHETPVGTLEPQVKRALADADPNLTVTSVRTMQQQVDRSFDQQRAVASLAGLFGVVALMLAAVGSMASLPIPWHNARTRSASGWLLAPIAAESSAMVLNGAFRRVAVGLALGLPLAVGAGRLHLGSTLRRQVLGSASPRSCRRVARCLRVRRGSYPGRTRSVHLADERPPGRISWRHPVGHACRTAACSSAPSP